MSGGERIGNHVVRTCWGARPGNGASTADCAFPLERQPFSNTGAEESCPCGGGCGEGIPAGNRNPLFPHRRTAAPRKGMMGILRGRGFRSFSSPSSRPLCKIFRVRDAFRSIPNCVLPGHTGCRRMRCGCGDCPASRLGARTVRSSTDEPSGRVNTLRYSSGKGKPRFFDGRRMFGLIPIALKGFPLLRPWHRLGDGGITAGNRERRRFRRSSPRPGRGNKCHDVFHDRSAGRPRHRSKRCAGRVSRLSSGSSSWRWSCWWWSSSC
jgi:hypothetical protein